MSKERQKGTAEETRIVNAWNEWICRDVARRNPAGAPWDVTVEMRQPSPSLDPIQVLSTRADRGEPLYTLRETDFIGLVDAASSIMGDKPIHIESKRYARFALHTIFFSKFGKRK